MPRRHPAASETTAEAPHDVSPPLTYGDPSSACRRIAESLVIGRSLPSESVKAVAEDLPEFLASHGLSGLAGRALGHGDLDLPTEAAGSVIHDWGRWRSWSAAIDLECERIGRALVSSRSQLAAPILLKGRAVARRYEDSSVRGYSDIDLLVPAQELPEWEALMNDLGYTSPQGWSGRTARRFSHHLPFSRPAGEDRLLCELHSSLFVERRARRLDYSVFVGSVETSAFTGMIELTTPALLLALALHHFRHHPSKRRLIWHRDIVELATTETVSEARSLAEAHQVGWALEWALLQIEELIGHPVWEAKLEVQPFGLARVLRLDRPGHLYEAAIARELGLLRGALFLASRLDPRRFFDSEERSPGASITDFVSRNIHDAVSTPWFRAFSRKR